MGLARSRNDRSLCRLLMEHRWALSKAECVLLWRNWKGFSETERQASHISTSIALAKVTTRCLFDSCSGTGRAPCGTWPAAGCTFSMARFRVPDCSYPYSSACATDRTSIDGGHNSRSLGKGGVKDAGPDAGTLDRPIHGDRCAGKAGLAPPPSTGYRFANLWMPANCR